MDYVINFNVKSPPHLFNVLLEPNIYVCASKNIYHPIIFFCLWHVIFALRISVNATYPGSFARAGSISGVSGHGDLVDSEQGLLRQVKETFMDWYLPEKTREEGKLRFNSFNSTEWNSKWVNKCVRVNSFDA